MAYNQIMEILAELITIYVAIFYIFPALQQATKISWFYIIIFSIVLIIGEIMRIIHLFKR